MGAGDFAERSQGFIENLTIQEIPRETAVAFIREYHYSKVIPRLCVYFLGIYHENQLTGVVGHATLTDNPQDFPTA